jgi:hypothetical protein
MGLLPGCGGVDGTGTAGTGSAAVAHHTWEGWTVFEVPNLDDMSIDPADYNAAAAVLGQLACYAGAKGHAMRLRLKGDIEAALSWERMLEGMYARLPQWAKW